MKNILLIIALIFSKNISSQELYIEGNIGNNFVRLNDQFTIVDKNEYASQVTGFFTFGANMDIGKSSIADMQFSLSFPYIISAKFSLGAYFGEKKKIAILVGARPYPFTFCTQINLMPKTPVQLITSFEFGNSSNISKNITAGFNFGIRIPISKPSELDIEAKEVTNQEEEGE